MDLLGELVRLRGPRPVDAEALLAVRSHPEVTRFAGPGPLVPPAPERPGEAAGQREPESVRWVVERRGDRALLGAGALHGVDFRNRNAWLSITLGPPSRWGRGYGTEAARLMTRFAFRQLGLEKVYAAVVEGNDRALRAARRAGYEVEAALERHHLQDDRLATEYWLAVYREHPLYLAG
jgi:RimJ/RimL family protein N-acetyltransferase